VGVPRGDLSVTSAPSNLHIADTVRQCHHAHRRSALVETGNMAQIDLARKSLSPRVIVGFWWYSVVPRPHWLAGTPSFLTDDPKLSSSANHWCRLKHWPERPARN
jgi:hypothetical protein